MTDRRGHDRLLADAAARAAAVFDDEAELGPCYFVATDGARYHRRQDGDDYVLTIVNASVGLEYRLVGVDGSRLT